MSGVPPFTTRTTTCLRPVYGKNARRIRPVYNAASGCALRAAKSATRLTVQHVYHAGALTVWIALN